MAAWATVRMRLLSRRWGEMSTELDISGFWVGEYRYFMPFEPNVGFLANIDDRAGQLSGSISEPNVYSSSSGTLFSFLMGKRDDISVKFAKVYDGDGDFAHRVDYNGALSSDGCRIEGIWTLEDWSGSFWMTREKLPSVEGEIERIEVLVR